MPAYIGFCPGPHTLAQPFETHLQRRHLVRLAEIGLEAHCNVLPRKIFLFFELEKQLLLFVQLNRTCLRGGALSLSLPIFRVFFIFSHTLKSLHLSETDWIWGYRHWSRSTWRSTEACCWIIPTVVRTRSLGRGHWLR